MKKQLFPFCAIVGIAVMLLIVPRGSRRVSAGEKAADDIGALRAEIEQLKTLVPDQAHAMQDVGEHFTNLWAAADAKNWPLADFYLGETRSHLKWAVRIKPMRQTKTGDVDLNAILQALDESALSSVKAAIDQKNPAAFIKAYRQTIEGCYGCHKASEKPYLHLQIPIAPATHIMNLDPNAVWPQ